MCPGSFGVPPVRAKRSPTGIVDQGVERLLVGLGTKRGMERQIGLLRRPRRVETGV